MYREFRAVLEDGGGWLTVGHGLPLEFMMI